MKSFKTMLLLTATLSVSLLAACGVESTEAQPGQEPGSQSSEAVRPVSEEAVAPGQQCTGSITCKNNTRSVSVLCTANGNSCSASCPTGTTLQTTTCAWTTPPPPPAPQPVPQPAPEPVPAPEPAPAQSL